MGEQASAAAAAEPEETIESNPDQGSEEADPMIFNVGDDGEDSGEKPEEKPAEKPAEPSKPSEMDEIKKQLADMEAKNNELQRKLNWKFASRRAEEKKAKEAETAPAFTDAQLLKVLEEHQGEPAVLLQVMKHMTEGQAKQTEKKAVESAEIKQQVVQTEAWLQTNFPQVFEEGSELHGQVESIKSMMRLEDHPLGNYMAVAASLLAGYPDAIKQAEERGKKSALAVAAEASRKKDIQNAAPAGGKTSKAAAGAADDAELVRQAKDMGLTGNAIKTYVAIRKQAAKQSKQVMEA